MKSLDPRKVLAFAFERSRLLREPTYVSYSSDGMLWEAFVTRPWITKSHWIVHPDGKLQAHIYEKGKTTAHDYVTIDEPSEA